MSALAWAASALDRMLPHDLLEAVADVNERVESHTLTPLEQESAPLYAALAVLALAYLVSRSFAAVYECTVDTIFVCAMRDHAEYGGIYMSDELRDAFVHDKPQQDSRRQMATSQGGLML